MRAGILCWWSLLGLAACDGSALVARSARLEVPAEVDFGRVVVGLGGEAAAPLDATGDLPVRISRWEIRPRAAPARVLAVPGTLPAGAAGEVRLRYRPPRASRLDARLLLFTDVGPEPREVRLRGEGVPGAVVVEPDPVDFGPVRVGDARRLQARVVNQLDAPLRARVSLDAAGGAGPEGDGVFAVLGGVGPEGELSLAPREAAEIALSFAPASVGAARGALVVGACGRGAADHPLCEARAPLEGLGVESGVRCRPSTLDFGFVAPGRVASRPVECENLTHRPLRLDAPTLAGPDAGRFEVTQAPGRLPPREARPIPVTVRPAPEDRGRTLSAQLALRAADADGWSDSLSTPLEARIARAELTAVPARVDLGEVAVGVDVDRTVVVANVGDRPVTVAGAAAPAPFAVDVSPRPLAPGATLPVRLELRAPSAGRVAATLEVQVDDPEVSDLRVPLTAEAVALPPCRVRFAPRRLDFGVVPTLSRTRRSVLVENAAAHPCLVRDPVASADAFRAVPVSGSLRLAPGERARLEVEYAPARAGEHRGELRIQVSDPADPVRAVPLGGAAGEGDLRVDPNRLDFGTVPPGCASAPREIRLANLGAAPLSVGQVVSTSSAFVIERAPPGLPAPPGGGVTVPGGGTVSLEVRFRPTGLGEAGPATLRVEEAGALVPQIVDLVGRARAGTVTERFEQRAAEAVDVLFVIDNSLSMEREQASVIANAGRFLSRLSASGADYRVGVISTDMDHPTCQRIQAQRPAGAPQGACGFFADGDASARDPAWRTIDPGDQPSPRAAFARVANLGLGGSAREEGLAAALRATRPILRGGHNQGFLRPDAALALIFVSDEEDQSPLSPGAYVAAFRSLKGAARPERLSASAVVTTGAACAYETGLRYRAVAEALSGLVRPICTSDWAGVVSDLADRALGLRASFPLAQPPVPGSLAVFVDGARAPSDAWRFDAADRQIIFAPGAVPAPGRRVEVRYQPACAP